MDMKEVARMFLYREGLCSSEFKLIRYTANDFYFKHKKTGKVWEFRR